MNIKELLKLDYKLPAQGKVTSSIPQNTGNPPMVDLLLRASKTKDGKDTKHTEVIRKCTGAKG